MRQAPRSKYKSSGDCRDGPRRVPVQDLSFGTSLPSSSAGSVNTHDSYRKEALFGFVLSVKDTFGFIQPYIGGENLYFGERDGTCNNLEYYDAHTIQHPEAFVKETK